tara:strand:- start:3792 stop:4352 length:561 start_codon:yes stop_codon:yes gene_type:complete
MVDRIELVAELGALPLKLTSTAERGLEKTLNKAISQMLTGLELETAKRAPGSVRQHVAQSFSDALTMAELKKVSKLWEPKRTVSAGLAHSELVRDLVELLEGRRTPFVPTKLSLPQARSLGGVAKSELASGIQHFCTPPQLKALLKKWDKHSDINKASDMDAIRHRLLALLSEEVVAASAPPKPKK